MKCAVHYHALDHGSCPSGKRVCSKRILDGHAIERRVDRWPLSASFRHSSPRFRSRQCRRWWYATAVTRCSRSQWSAPDPRPNCVISTFVTSLHQDGRWKGSEWPKQQARSRHRPGPLSRHSGTPQTRCAAASRRASTSTSSLARSSSSTSRILFQLHVNG